MYRSQTYVRSNSGIATRKVARPAILSVAVFTAALLLSACAQSGGRPLAADAGARKSSKFVAHGVMGKTAPATQAAAVTVPPKTTTAPATIWQSGDKLLGLAAEELQAALGAPARIRDEESGRIYQYVGSDCVLDLFLYQEDAGGYRVSYAEARSITADKKPVDTCLKSLPAPVVAANAQPSS